MIVYVARHAESEHNLKDLFHDTTVSDVSLTPKGIDQANRLAQELRTVKLDVIYVSELLRTQQTAEIVNKYHNVQIIVEPLLNDIVSGIAGHPVSDFDKLLATSSDPWNEHFEGAESYNDVVSRVTLFLRKLERRNYTTILVITSGGLVNNMYGLANGLSNEEMYSRPIANAALLKFDIGDLRLA